MQYKHLSCLFLVPENLSYHFPFLLKDHHHSVFSSVSKLCVKQNPSLHSKTSLWKIIISKKKITFSFSLSLSLQPTISISYKYPPLHQHCIGTYLFFLCLSKEEERKREAFILLLLVFHSKLSKPISMVVLSKPAIKQMASSYMRNSMAAAGSSSAAFFSGVPLIDLSAPDAKHLIVKACEELGFFKVVNHGVPMEFISTLESESTKFFSLPLSEKQRAGPPSPFGYGNKQIGRNGDVGWVEYLLLNTHLESNSDGFLSIFGQDPQKLR